MSQILAEFLPDTDHRQLGDTFLIGLKNIRDERGSDIADSILSVSFNLYNSAGTAVTGIADTLLTTNGISRVLATYLLATGASKVITAAGTYRATYKVALKSGQTRTFQQTIEIKANPE